MVEKNETFAGPESGGEEESGKELEKKNEEDKENFVDAEETLDETEVLFEDALETLDYEPEKEPMSDYDNSDSELAKVERERLQQLVNTAVQWELALHQIKSDRADETWRTGTARCQCSKAGELVSQCEGVKEGLVELLGRPARGDLQQAADLVRTVSSALRSNISIQIPVFPSSTVVPTELSKRASSLVDRAGGEGLAGLVTEAVDGTVELVRDLLAVHTCTHPPDPPTAAGLLAPPCLVNTTNTRGVIRKAEGEGSAPQAKRFRAGRRSRETAEGFRPFPRPPPTDVLGLLEKKKKRVKSNGLHQFVLWREAYKGERERVSEVETRSSQKFLAMAKRRKRSPFINKPF